MPPKRTATEWGYNGNTPRSETQFQALAQATKLRRLTDMSEREIRALERLYNAKVARPAKPKQANGATTKRR